GRGGQPVARGGNLLSTSMKIGIQLRLILFAFALLTIVLAIAWSAQTTWKEARMIEDKIGKAQVESFEIADHFQETILHLSGALRRYTLHQNPADWDRFMRQSEEL